jgi:hypothetical protein
VEGFWGYHFEWNLGSPGGWDYQRITQVIGKAVWKQVNRLAPTGLELDFDHPLLYPIDGFVKMLVAAHQRHVGTNPGLIAVIAEEETLADVTENINLSERLNGIAGLKSALMAPHELEMQAGRVSYRGTPVSIAFVDFNTDVLFNLHRRHNLKPLLQLVAEGRVINPRGTEPINVKSMFELLTSEGKERFSRESIVRTPWTRRFRAGRALGPNGERITDLVEWTRRNWDNLVLKPERGYSGIGVRVGGSTRMPMKRSAWRWGRDTTSSSRKSPCISGLRSASVIRPTGGVPGTGSDRLPLPVRQRRPVRFSGPLRRRADQCRQRGRSPAAGHPQVRPADQKGGQADQRRHAEDRRR